MTVVSVDRALTLASGHGTREAATLRVRAARPDGSRGRSVRSAQASPRDAPRGYDQGVEHSGHEQFDAVLAPILRDLAAGHVAAPRLGPLAGGNGTEPGPAELILIAPDGSGCGISLLPGAPFAEQLARVADQVQEWAVEVLWTAGESAVWPCCPEHPDSHPLHAQVQRWLEGARHEDAAVWVCPKSGHVACAIGEFGAAAHAARSRHR